MPRRKTKVLLGNFLQYRLDDIERRLRARLRASREIAPPDLQRSIILLVIAHDLPDILCASSPAGERLRLDLATLLTKYPEHAIAGLRTMYRKPKVDASASAVVREFLLTHALLEAPAGQTKAPMGATDGEIAMAAEEHYKRATGRQITISKKVVKGERRRLERKYGESIYSVVKFHICLTATLYPKLYPARERKRLRRELLASLYS